MLAAMVQALMILYPCPIIMFFPTNGYVISDMGFLSVVW